MTTKHRQQLARLVDHRVQFNFYIRIVDRPLWKKASEKAEDEDTNLYELFTKFLREWVKT